MGKIKVDTSKPDWVFELAFNSANKPLLGDGKEDSNQKCIPDPKSPGFALWLACNSAHQPLLGRDRTTKERAPDEVVNLIIRTTKPALLSENVERWLKKSETNENANKSERVITDPEGVIYQLAAERLAETTFPKGVKNPLPEEAKTDNEGAIKEILVIEIKIYVRKDVPDGRD